MLLNDPNCLTFITVVTYKDAYFNRRNFITNNEGKSGMYHGTHLDTN